MTYPPSQLQRSERRSAGGAVQKFAMSRWLLSCVLLVLIEVGRPAAVQNALEKVLEDFHGRNLVQAAFRGEMTREVVEVRRPGRSGGWAEGLPREQSFTRTPFIAETKKLD